MKINTKWSLKDEVWFMRSNRPYKTSISSIEYVIYENESEPKVSYRDNDGNIETDNLYETKEELINSL